MKSIDDSINMVVRVAKAMAEADRVRQEDWGRYLQMARAAIAAMREPTPEMKKATSHTAMIDAALIEPQA